MGIFGIFGNKNKEREEEEQLKNSPNFKKRYSELNNLMDLIVKKSEINKELLENENNTKLKGVKIGKYEMTSILNDENFENKSKKKYKFFLKNTERNTLETYTSMEKIFAYELFFDKSKQRHLPKDDEMLTKQGYQELKDKYALNFSVRLEDIKREYCIDDSLKVEDNIDISLNLPKKEIQKEIKFTIKDDINFKEKPIEINENKEVNFSNLSSNKIDDFEEKTKNFVEDKEERKKMQDLAILKYGTKYKNDEEKYTRYNYLRVKYGMKEISSKDINISIEKRHKAGFYCENELTSDEKNKLSKIKLKVLSYQELCAKNNMELGDVTFKSSSFKNYDNLELKKMDMTDNQNFKILGEKKSGEVVSYNLEGFLKLGEDNYKVIMKEKLDKGEKGAIEVKNFIDKYNKTDFDKEKAYRDLKLKNGQHIKALLLVGDKTKKFTNEMLELENISNNLKTNFDMSDSEKNEIIKEKAKEVTKNILENFENELKNRSTSNELYKIISKVIGKEQLDKKIYDFTLKTLSDKTYDTEFEEKAEVKELKTSTINNTQKDDVNKNLIVDDLIDEIGLEDFEM